MSRAALLVEDNSSHAELIADELESALEGWTLDQVPTLAEARVKMASRPYDLFVFDFRLPDGDGIELLREVRAQGIATPTIFVTTATSATLAVTAMKLGADDYLVKEEGYLAVLPYLVQEVLKRRRLAAERREPVFDVAPHAEVPQHRDRMRPLEHRDLHSADYCNNGGSVF